jgi:hypothetical protein
MKSYIAALILLAITILLATPPAATQSPLVEDAAHGVADALLHEDNTASSAAFVIASRRPHDITRFYRPFSGFGLGTRVGIAGAGFDIATPLARKFNLRAGTDFFNYETNFQEEGANVGVNLHLRSGHLALDWFLTGGRFRLSPQLVFGNNNRIIANVVIPSGSTVTLDGEDFISSYSDPLHGTGRIDFRKVSPGLSMGFGNLIPRDHSRVSIPVEIGFYYAGQPTLQLAFTGSACDPNYPPSIGCESVSQDTGFQQSLSAFRARNEHNLSYASFFPIFSAGVGFRFW